jgi:hypothetical protein
MNDDLLDADWTAQESALLGSAELDVAPQGSTERTLAALGLGVTLASTAALTASAAGAKATMGNGVAVWLKWAASLAAGVGAIGAVALALRPAPQATPTARPRSAPPAVSAPAPLVEERAVEPTPPSRIVATADSDEPQAGFRPPPRPPLAKNKVPIADEIKAIDDARTLLRAGNPSAALQFLDSYDKMVGRHGSMQAEATIVRIEALEAGGNPAGAVALGKRFLAAHPNSPYQYYLKRLLKLP